MSALVLGDLHLGKGLSVGKPAELGKLNSRIQDQVDLLDWAYNECKLRGINNIVLTGDIYQDFKPHPTVIGVFMRWLKKCERGNVFVHIAMGNHDILRSGQYVVSALDLVKEVELEGARVYKNITRVELDDFTMVIIPFSDKRMYDVDTKDEALERLYAELSAVTQEPSNKPKVCIGHLAIEGSLSVGDEITDHLNELFVPTEMFSWFDYVWMGHIHHPQVIQEQSPHVAHIGSLDISDFSKSELEHPKIAIVLDFKNNAGFEQLPIPTRNLRPIKIEVPPGKESTEFVINELCLISKKLNIKDSIVRLEIILSGEELENVDRVKVHSYLLNNLEVHHICGFSETRSFDNIEINPEDVFDNTMGIVDSINKWADTRDYFENEQEREEFKAQAHEVRLAYEEKYS